MLYISSDITRYQEFRETFRKAHDTPFLDLSRVPSAQLAEEAESVVAHHQSCHVFLGYLEPGWMLDSTHQTRMRTLFRKFPVGIVTVFTTSLPFSWKNEINTFYTKTPLNQNGNSNSIHDGSSLHDECGV